MSQHKVNRYVCSNPDCNGETITIDLHEGTTPFMLQCRHCNLSMAQSSFYRTNQFVDASIAFIRPTTGPYVESDHVKAGGLMPVPNGQPLPKILPQKQPNPASCLVTSFAMILGVPVAELIDQIGHDGTEKLFPELSAPYCYRGHHIQELIFACFERGYAVTPIEPIPVSQSKDQHYAHTNLAWWLEKILCMRNGVVVGKLRSKSHSLAWDRENFYDPAIPEIVPINHIEMQTFFFITPKSNQIFNC